MFKFFLASIALLLFSGCNNKGTAVTFSVSMDRDSYREGDNIDVAYVASKKAEVDSAILYIENIRVSVADNNNRWSGVLIENKRFGTLGYEVILYNKGVKSSRKGSFKYLPKEKPEFKNIEVSKIIARGCESYTQGYEFYNGKLYESSGLYDSSFLRILEFPSLREIKKVAIDKQYFAEGITILDDKLYMLTWKEKKCFVFNPGTLERLDTLDYDSEGWGLTNDGEYLYMSDGSQNIYKRNSSDFSIVSKIEVATSDGIVPLINELEWIGGKIWANVYGYNVILVIDPKSGKVEQSIMAHDLLKPSDIKADTDVLNGIAHNPYNGKTYITGKLWPKIFEIK